MRAVILAAGEGLRLRPFTLTRPKVMLPVAGRPILEYVVDALKENGVTDITMVIGYQKERIQSYFENGRRFGVSISYAVQAKQLGTAHALLQAKGKASDGAVLVLPGDNLVDPDTLHDLLEKREKDRNAMVVTFSPNPSKYGVVQVEDGWVTRITEKPAASVSDLINTGIYLFEPRVFELAEWSVKASRFDISDVLEALIERGDKIQGIEIEGHWLDIVYPWDILSVNTKMLQQVVPKTAGTIEPGAIVQGPVSVGKGTVVRSGSYIRGPCVIGEGCDIGPSVVVFPSTSIGHNVTIGPFTQLRNSVIHDNVSIGGSSYVANSVIDDGTITRSHFVTHHGDRLMMVEGDVIPVSDLGAIIGDTCSFGPRCLLDAGVVVGRRAKVDGNVHVSRDVPNDTTVL
jgi:UDP-N-acetylglucosamine diphosphorylase/glucosamine-1-phosphate N-acetyltransferase